VIISTKYQVPSTKLIRWFCCSVVLLCFSSVSADLPLTIEDLLSKKGQTRFQLSATYLNNQQHSADLLVLPPVQSNNIQNANTLLGKNLSNTDTLVTTASLRHGIAKNTELYGRLSAIATDYRSQNYRGQIIGSDSNTHFSSAWLGVNHRFRDDFDNKPALLGFAELQLAHKPDEDAPVIYGKSVILGGTTYQTYDPVVLSLTGSIQLNTSYKRKKKTIKPGLSLSLSPSVAFAVNDRVTLTSGFNWRYRGQNKIQGKTTTIRNTSTGLNLGMGYAPSKKSIVSLNVRSDISGGSDAQVNASWTYKMDK
jgi:hypothetical protein